ncbi:hypothetical protein H072_889 [Dactylellina haptotyla CBS 200.50]|uniref:BTB domain-containing protein n=1 Tax=Dactylellina haptotyla (strain CBS 200.50) TaxID=1284197 RepID=S8AQI0_DACHA|nr:hypothetical protein H072_889 [Dactylellina haptotyla CBS 200.50]
MESRYFIDPAKDLNTKFQSVEMFVANCSPLTAASNDAGATLQYSSSLYKIPPRQPEEEAGVVSQTPETQPPISFGKDCDHIVRLESSEHIAEYLVTSAVLQLASPVWARCIRPTGFAALEQGILNDIEYPVLKLYDDDFECLTFLFRIIHFQTTNVPKLLTYPQLRKMAIICDKYNCWPALQGWKNTWFDDWIPYATEPGYEDWLFIAAQGDYAAHSKMQALKGFLIQESGTLSGCRSYFMRYLGDKSYKVSCELLPQPVMDSLWLKRRNAIEEIVTQLRSFASFITNPQDTSDNINAFFCKDVICRDLALGSLYRSLKEMELWPLINTHPSVSVKWHSSLGQLNDRIKKLRMTTLAFCKTTDAAELNITNHALYRSPLNPEHKTTLEYYKPNPRAKIYDFALYGDPAYREISYTITPCPLAFKFGDFRITVEKIFSAAK